MKLLTAATTRPYEVQVIETVTRLYTKRVEAISATMAEQAASDELDQVDESLDLRDVGWKDYIEDIGAREVRAVREVR